MRTVVVFTGPPGSGKTSLAKVVASELGMPLFTKDALKVVLYETLGWGGRERDRELGRAAYALLMHLVDTELSAARSVVVESNFRPESEVWLRELAADHGARIVQVRCHADRDTIVRRVRDRAGTHDRHPGHSDEEWLSEELDEVLRSGQALDLPGALIEVDTTTEVPPSVVVERVSEALNP